MRFSVFLIALIGTPGCGCPTLACVPVLQLTVVDASGSVVPRFLIEATIGSEVVEARCGGPPGTASHGCQGAGTIHFATMERQIQVRVCADTGDLPCTLEPKQILNIVYETNKAAPFSCELECAVGKGMVRVGAGE